MTDRFLFVIAIGALYSGAVGQPVAIEIVNAGFEDDLVAEGCFEVFQPSGWDIYDPNGIFPSGGNVVGGLNLPVGSVYFPAGAPEGQHAGIVFLQDSIGSGPAGLTQVLDAVLEGNTRYTLSVEVGDIASGVGPPPCDVFGFFDLDGFPGYQVQLLAGGEVVTEDDNTLAELLTDGVFLTSTRVVDVGADDPRIGQPLEVRLINLNMEDSPEHPGIEVDFDDVRLTAEAIGAVGGDMDGDGDVDLVDFAAFQLCFTGTCEAAPCEPALFGDPDCEISDFDTDGDVDLTDFGAFQLAFTG
jgi:hypothetical protein